MKSLILIILLITRHTECLRCFTCTQSNDDCSEYLRDFQNISNEPCNGRCFIRRDLNNIISRGCDVRFWYSGEEKIPDNGCKVRTSGEVWCWCKHSDFCNKNSIESTLVESSTIISSLIQTTAPKSILIYEGCLNNQCKNGGTCYSNHFSSNFFICVCLPFYTGKTCSTPISENSMGLEDFLQKFLKNNFQVYEQINVDDEDSSPINSLEIDENETVKEEKTTDEIQQQLYYDNEEDNKEVEAIDGIIELQ